MWGSRPLMAITYQISLAAVLVARVAHTHMSPILVDTTSVRRCALKE